MGCCQLSFNPFCCTDVFKIIWHILSFVITHDIFNLPTYIFLDQCFEFIKCCKILILLLHEKDLMFTIKIINKYNMILMFGHQCYQEWSTHIRMDSIEDLLCLIVFVMKGRFGVFYQSTPFACIKFLQCTFGKTSRNLLHDFQSTMMKLTQSLVPQLTDVLALHCLYFHAQGNTIFYL